jgi:multidrug transporter EmrE-like cation transporter
MTNHWTLILIAAVANVALNLSLKQGAKSLDTSAFGALVKSLFLSPWIWAGGICAAVLLTAFITAIRSYSLSLTYTAVTALAMVVLTVIGATLQQDQITLLRVMGLALIVVGLVMTAAA